MEGGNLEDSPPPISSSSVVRINWADDGDGGPLGNPKILSKILNVYNPSFCELRNFRLVSRLWHEVSLDMWRGVATLKLIQDIPEPPEMCSSATLQSPLYQSREHTGVPMSEFLANIVDPSDPYDLDTKPYSRVKLKGIDIETEMEFTGTTSEIINVFPRIWELIGPFVTYLHCEECTFENTIKMGAFQKLVLERTPFLQQLVMTNTVLLAPSWEQNPHLIIRYDYNYHFTTLHIYGDFPMGLGNFLPYIPKIEELIVRNGLSEGSHEKHFFSTVWVPFSNLRKINKTSFSLRRMDVMHSDTFKITFNPTNQFRATALPLNLFGVEISPFPDMAVVPAVASGSRGTNRLRIADDLLAPMLKEHRRTLEIFKVFKAPFSEPFANFPFGILLENMKELYLWGNITDSLNFLKNMPNLCVLFVNTTCYEKWAEMEDLLELEFPHEYQPFKEDMVRYTGCFQTRFTLCLEFMTELHIELALQPESIVILAEWMPNLKIFKSILDKATFRAVCAAMINLEELGFLFGSEVENDTITGVAPGIPRDSANITSLKQLRKFQLDAYCGKGLLKDSAVYLGFLKMSYLLSVQICVSRQMSERAEEELKAVVPVVRFIRNYGPGPHVGCDCCRRSRFARDVMRRFPSAQSLDGCF